MLFWPCSPRFRARQARRLLALLARSNGRHDLVRPLASTGACGSRAGSVPPPHRRQAATPSERRSLSPSGYLSQHRTASREPRPMAMGFSPYATPMSVPGRRAELTVKLATQVLRRCREL